MTTVNENKTLELLKEFYSKHQSVVDALADADEKMFKAVKAICCREMKEKAQPSDLTPAQAEPMHG